MNNIICVAGPTASGKTALSIARSRGGPRRSAKNEQIMNILGQNYKETRRIDIILRVFITFRRL